MPPPEGGYWYLAYRGARPQMGFVPVGKGPPADVVVRWWCRPGDEQWTKVNDG